MALFVTLEGVEGAGKSTLRDSLAVLLKNEFPEIVTTREPGATKLGQIIRSLLLDPANKELDPLAELMLFSADRAQHVAEIIRPALTRGALVLCDRFIHSTLAYQGYGRGLHLPLLEGLNSVSTGNLAPDLVLLLDLPPEEGLRRAEARASASIDAALTRFEEHELSFHQRVREGFLELAKQKGAPIVVLNARLAPQDLTAIAAREIRALKT